MIAGKKDIGVYILIFLFFVLNNFEKSKPNKKLIFKMVRKERCIEHVKIETLFFSHTFPYMEDNLHFCTGNKRKERRILTKE